MSDFVNERLREAATAAEARAVKAEAAAVEALEQVAYLKKRFKEARRQLIRDALRALHCPPFLVIPHIAPARKAAAVPGAANRFSLLELE